jgi:hypothetical protein
MDNVHDFWEMRQASQNLHATQMEFCAQNRQVTAVRYILATEDIVKPSWSLFQHEGAAAFKFSEGSDLPPAVSTKDIAGGRTQILNVCQIPIMNRPPVECDEHCAPQSMSVTEDWLNLNGDLENPNDNENNCAADVEPCNDQDNCIKDPHCPQQRDVSTMPNFP